MPHEEMAAGAQAPRPNCPHRHDGLLSHRLDPPDGVADNHSLDHTRSVLDKPPIVIAQQPPIHLSRHRPQPNQSSDKRQVTSDK